MYLVPEDASAQIEPGEPSGTSTAVYNRDPMFPVGAMYVHPRDAVEMGLAQFSSLTNSETLQSLQVGGQPGLVDRNAFDIGTGFRMLDAHNFRGDIVTVPSDVQYGANGDAGGSGPDYSTQYALGLAANAYPSISDQESRALISSHI